MLVLGTTAGRLESHMKEHAILNSTEPERRMPIMHCVVLPNSFFMHGSKGDRNFVFLGL